MQLPSSFLCLLFLVCVHFGACSLRGSPESAAVSISPAYAVGASVTGCVTSIANVPSGWVVTRIPATAPNCPTLNGVALIGVTMRNLNFLTTEPTAIACLSATTVLPTGWVATVVSTNANVCAVFNNVVYLTATITYVQDKVIGTTINTCVNSVTNIPAGWFATVVTTHATICPTVGGIIHSYATLKKAVILGTATACLTTLATVPSGWLVTKVAANSACATVGNVPLVLANLATLTSGTINTSGSETTVCVTSAIANIPENFFVEKIYKETNTCPTVNGVNYLTAILKNVK
jgi:hypothetical protein